MKSLKSLIIYRVLSANHGSWTPPPAVEVIWSVNTMQKGFRPGFNQVTETIYWKSWVLKDVSNRITSFAVPRTCKNSSKTVSKARLSSQMHRSRQTIFHGLKKVKKSHAGIERARPKPPARPHKKHWKPHPGPIRNIENETEAWTGFRRQWRRRPEQAAYDRGLRKDALMSSLIDDQPGRNYSKCWIVSERKNSGNQP